MDPFCATYSTKCSLFETHAFVENKLEFKPGAIFAAEECFDNSRSNLGTSTKIYPIGGSLRGFHGKRHYTHPSPVKCMQFSEKRFGSRK